MIDKIIGTECRKKIEELTSLESSEFLVKFIADKK
jgi:hypothetical protein